MKKNNDIKATDKLLPKAYRPLSSWCYFGRTVLYLIPIIGQIFLFAHAIDDKNCTGRNFARSFFCTLLVAAIGVAAYIVVNVLR